MSALPPKADIGTQPRRDACHSDSLVFSLVDTPIRGEFRLVTTEVLLPCYGLRVPFSALRKFLSEQPKLFATPRATAPDETNFARRLIGKERAGDKTGPEQKAGLDG